MTYVSSMSNAANWLEGIQATSGGWGLNQGQAPSIVNTVEAAYVLLSADRSRYYTKIKEAVNFIERNCLKHLEMNPRTRYATFGLLLVHYVPELFSANILTIQRWLLEARNSDGGWGHEARDQKSELFPTVMALQVLRDFEESTLQASYNWIKGRCVVPGRWSFGPNQGPSPVATAMGVCALKHFEDISTSFYHPARDELVSFSSWGVVGENQPGTNWIHNSWMWVIPALLALDVAPYEKTIAEGVRQLNFLQTEHGWREPDPFGHTTVRGQYWATVTCQSIKDAFDPSVHPYRIDSAIAAEQMREPEFVIVKPYRKWSVVLPGALYRAIAIACLFVSSSVFLGLHRFLPDLPRWIDFPIALVFFAGAY